MRYSTAFGGPNIRDFGLRRSLRSSLVLTIASLSVACSSGGTAPSGNPPPLGGREVPSFLREGAGSDREAPGGGRDAPSPPIGGGGGGACIQCNTTYTCIVSGKSVQLTVTAQPGGWCGTKDGGGLQCGGAVVDGNGVKDGTWKALPGGGFQLCSSAGDCSISCTPGPTPSPATSG